MPYGPKRSVREHARACYRRGSSTRLIEYRARFNNHEPDDEVVMSFQFAEILNQELQSLGGTPLNGAKAHAAKKLALPSSVGLQDTPAANPSAPVADRIVFSYQAQTLSYSLREYAQDPARPCCGDSDVIAGWSEAGYLRKSGSGISGKMTFTTQTGAVVTIAGVENTQEPHESIRFSVKNDKAEYHFSGADLKALGINASEGPVFALEAALSGSERETTDAHSGTEETKAYDSGIAAYSMTGEGRRIPRPPVPADTFAMTC